MEQARSAPTVTVNVAEARRQGYTRAEDANRACARALRWLRRRRNLRAKPPRHIADKINLLQVVPDGSQG